VEKSFGTFCDDYIELVKSRRYGDFGPEGAGSANTALASALSVYLRLFAPYLPFVTEEVWSWWREGSVHRATWPTPDEIDDRGDAQVYLQTSQVLAEIRRHKSLNGWKTKTPVHVVVEGDAARVAAVRVAEKDLGAAVSASSLTFREGEGLGVRVEAAELVEGQTEPRG
jgi:valyl-tRNA synthetase